MPDVLGSELRLREWQDVHRQLLEMVQQFGLKQGKRRIVTTTAETDEGKSVQIQLLLESMVVMIGSIEDAYGKYIALRQT